MRFVDKKENVKQVSVGRNMKQVVAVRIYFMSTIIKHHARLLGANTQTSVFV